MIVKQYTEISVSTRTVVQVVAIIIITLLGFKFLSKVGHVIELLFISFFLSLALNPAVSWIARNLKVKSRAAATGVAYLAVVLVLGAFVSYVVPPLVRQTVDFISTVPDTVRTLNDENSTLGKYVVKYNLQEQVDGFSSDLQERTKHIQQPVISTAGRVGSALISILTVIVLTFMMLAEGPLWIKRYWSFHPSKRSKHDRMLAEKMYRTVTGYVNGQVVLAFLASFLGMIMLIISSTILGVTVNALALAGIMFICGLIPMIGQLLGAVIVVTSVLFVSWPLALIMTAFILIYQQIENVTLQPYIQSKFNELTPLLVFSAALLGIGFGGLIGAFVAIPAVGCAKILILDYLNRKKEGSLL